jgi:hypothetical protein
MAGRKHNGTTAEQPQPTTSKGFGQSGTQPEN